MSILCLQVEYFFSCYLYGDAKCSKIAWMAQSRMVLVHIKAYSFKLHVFWESFWILLVKSSFVQKYPQKLGPVGTFRLCLCKQQGHGLCFGPEGQYNGVVDCFFPWMWWPCPQGLLGTNFGALVPRTVPRTWLSCWGHHWQLGQWLGTSAWVCSWPCRACEERSSWRGSWFISLLLGWINSPCRETKKQQILALFFTKKISENVDSAASLGSVFCHFFITAVGKLFIVYNQNLFCFSLNSLFPLLTPWDQEHSISLVFIDISAFFKLHISRSVSFSL